MEKLVLVMMLGALGCAQEHQVFVDDNRDGDAGRDDAAPMPDARVDASVSDAQQQEDAQVTPDASAIDVPRFGRPENCGLSEAETRQVAAKYGGCFPDADMEYLLDAMSTLGIASALSSQVFYGASSVPGLGDCAFFDALLSGPDCAEVYVLLQSNWAVREACTSTDTRCSGDVMQACHNPSWVRQAFWGQLPDEDPEKVRKWHPIMDCAAFGETCMNGNCSGPSVTGGNYGDPCNLSCPSDTVCEWIAWGGEAPSPMCHEPTPVGQPDQHYAPGDPSCGLWGYGTSEQQCDGLTWKGCVYASPIEISCEEQGFTRCGAGRGCYCEKGHEDEPGCGLPDP